MIYEYEWDDKKCESNFAKHGLDFAEAGKVIENPESITTDDVKHSLFECRRLTIGYLDNILCTAVIHTKRNLKIRIISFRPASKKERQYYDNRKIYK